MIIDTHCHLNDNKLLYFTPSIVETKDQDNMLAFICIGTDEKTSLLAVKEAEMFEPIYATVGLHPEFADEYSEELEKKFIEFAKHEKVVAFGEIGLDYYGSENPEREVQIEAFEKQIILADKLGLPLVIHVRDAFEDTLNILKKHKDKINNGGVIHCFSGSVETAKILINMGFHLSFNGVLTFKNAKKCVEVLKSVPIERVLVETDSPYLSPEPFRGKINEPKNVNLVSKKMSEILEIDIETIEEQLNKNARNLFKKLKV